MPQVTMDVDYENGMGVSIGRLREDSMYDFKFIGLSHNTVRGAAGGAGTVRRGADSEGIHREKVKKEADHYGNDYDAEDPGSPRWT